MVEVSSKPPFNKRCSCFLLTFLLIKHQLNVVNKLGGGFLPHNHTNLLGKVSIVVVPMGVCVWGGGGGGGVCVCEGVCASSRVARQPTEEGRCEF